MSLGALADLSVGLVAAVVLLKVCLDHVAKVRAKREVAGKLDGNSTTDVLVQIDAKLTDLLVDVRELRTRLEAHDNQRDAADARLGDCDKRLRDVESRVAVLEAQRPQ